MKHRLSNIYIGAVAALGGLCFIVTFDVRQTAAMDPVMFVFIMVLAGVAQRYPVMLFRSSSISVAFAVKIAAYVLFGTGVALWATLVVAAVNAYTPKRKPARKVLFNLGQFLLATYLASSTYQAVGGLVPPGSLVPTLLAVAVSAAVYFLAGSMVTSALITMTWPNRVVDLWLRNFQWMPLSSRVC